MATGVCILLHGFWNYVIQRFLPRFTTTAEAGTMIPGESVWVVAVFCIALALVFWQFRNRLPILLVKRM